MNFRSIAPRRWAVAATMTAALLVVGCKSEDKTPAYPTPATDCAMGSMGTSVKVPAGATMIAASGYPIAPFSPPENGTVYVYDADSNTIPLVTTGTQGKMIDLATMQSANSTLNPKHQFRIYFLPAKQATTLAAPLGS